MSNHVSLHGAAEHGGWVGHVGRRVKLVGRVWNADWEGVIGTILSVDADDPAYPIRTYLIQAVNKPKYATGDRVTATMADFQFVD